MSPPPQDRASKLVGLRLEKHMEKIREQYQQQKEEEEKKRILYHSPQLLHKDDEDQQGSPERWAAVRVAR